MSSENRRTVAAVRPGSIAEESGIRPGDVLLSIDGTPVPDVFDYRIRTAVPALVVRVRQSDGEELEVEIEKDVEEDLGLEFDDPLMDDCGSCRNDCVFCFIDQLPDGMRPTLYFRDDDLRLSYLSGNYVTLTNLDDAALGRLIALRLTPVNVSVHATDPVLRAKMMNNRFAGKVLDLMRRIVDGGLDVNAQIVLCRDWNDGAALDRTLRDLETLGPRLGSVAVVPVGLTRHRDAKGLIGLLPYDRASARETIAQVDRWRADFAARRGNPTVYAADELYLRAELPIPGEAYYDDYPQLENGVGLLALFRREVSDGLAKRRRRRARKAARAAEAEAAGSGKTTAAPAPAPAPRAVHVATGVDAAPFLAEAAQAAAPFFGLGIRVHPVANRFFGETVTVAGLVTGQDLIATLAAALAGEPDAGTALAAPVLIPSCMLRSGEEVFLDDRTLADVEAALGRRAVVAVPTGEGLLDALEGIAEGRSERAVGIRRTGWEATGGHAHG